MDRCNLAISSGLSSRKELNKSHSPMGKRVSAGDWDTAVSAMPNLTEQIHNEGIQWLRLLDQTEDNGENDSQPSFEFSPCFLEELSGALSNERFSSQINRYGPKTNFSTTPLQETSST